MHLWMREILWIFWMNMHAWMHELFLPFWYCSIFKKECIYECIKLDFFLFYYFWIMHIWMHEIWFSFILLFLKNAYMNAWNSIFFCFVIFEECIYECMEFDFLLFCYFWRIYIWMHAIRFSFVLLFLKNTYINAWNLIFFCFVIFEECIYECMKFDFVLFCYLWRMHIWMHEIWFSFILLFFEECIYECMKFNFFLFC